MKLKTSTGFRPHATSRGGLNYLYLFLLLLLGTYAKAADTSSGTTTYETVYEWAPNGGESAGIGTTTYNSVDGTASVKNTDAIKFTSNFSAKDNKGYITIKPSEGSFSKDDKITITTYSSDYTGIGIDVYYSLSGEAKHNVTIQTAGTLTTQEFSLTEDCEALYIARNGGKTVYATAIKVERATVTPDPEPEPDPSVTTVVYDFLNSTGTTKNGVNCTAGTGKITFGSDYRAKEGKFITILPKSGSFKVGDIIELKGFCDSKSPSGVEIHTTATGESIFKTNVLAKSTEGGSTYTYTLTTDCDSLCLGRFGGGNTYLTSLTVTRPASSADKTRLTASFEKNSDVIVNTTTTHPLPALTVKAGEDVLTSDDYTVSYTSNSESVATISESTITIKGTGITTITATVTPKDDTKYEGCTATYQLTVKEPTPLNISTIDVSINTTDAEVEQPIIKVYGDNDQLLKLGTDYTLSFEVTGDQNVKVDEQGVFTVTGKAYAWTKGTSIIKVTATPTASMGNTFTAGSIQFTYDVTEGKLKPKFLSSFENITIKLHMDKNKRTFIVPLIANGEDVSSYFKYTYTIEGTDQASNVSGNQLTYTPSTEGTFKVTVNATPATDGDNNYSEVYESPAEISFTLDVKAAYTHINIGLDPEKINMYTGTTEGAPDVTVTDDQGNIIDDSKITAISWLTNSPGVVKVDANTGKLEALSEGNAKVRVYVSGDGLEDVTKFFDVIVDDPALYRAKDSEKYGNQATFWNQDKTMSVVLGGWMFNDIDKTRFDDKESFSVNNAWATTASKAKWKLTGFDYYVMSDNSKNARQEDGANAMPETTTIHKNKNGVENKENIKDQMFNVPCSGSFIVFNPKTNGTVNAHIFQNGVFDAKDGDYQYRPQRRVFIMDESGNFVSSDAHIENTNGKPTGKQYTLSEYKWDWKGGQAPTIDLVNEHFTGLDNFEMSADGFKNNVYESNLSQDIAPNEAAVKYPNVKGSHGWCVLADSPVTYTFKVKAGKTYYLYNFGSKIGFYGFSFEEDKNAPIVDEVTYADGQENTVTKTKEGHVAKVCIKRSMKADIWTTCVLPFSLNKQQVDAIFGKTYDKNNTEGTQILYYDRVENGKVYFVRHAYNTIVAGKPFLIKPCKDVEEINTANVADYPYVIIENEKPENWCEGNGYAWVSSYSNDLTVKEGDGFISNLNGNFKNFIGDPGTLKGFRGYLKALDAAKVQKLSVVTKSNTGNDNGATTAIDDLRLYDDADATALPTDGKVYNINGQLISNDANKMGSLPRGIYIINGKKYIK